MHWTILLRINGPIIEIFFQLFAFTEMLCNLWLLRSITSFQLTIQWFSFVYGSDTFGIRFEHVVLYVLCLSQNCIEHRNMASVKPGCFTFFSIKYARCYAAKKKLEIIDFMYVNVHLNWVKNIKCCLMILFVCVMKRWTFSLAICALFLKENKLRKSFLMLLLLQF